MASDAIDNIRILLKEALTILEEKDINSDVIPVEFKNDIKLHYHHVIEGLILQVSKLANYYELKRFLNNEYNNATYNIKAIKKWTNSFKFAEYSHDYFNY